MGVQLIASDLDGTLFGDDHLVQPRTVAAVNAVVEAGITFAAVTGRSHFGGSRRARSTGALMQWFIGSNGGHRLNYESGVLEERLLFEAEVLEEVFHELPHKVGDIGFGREHEAGFSWDRRFLELHPQSVDGGPRRQTASAASLHDVGKLFVAHGDVTTFDLVDLVRPHLPDDMHVTTSGITFIEVTPPGADKGAALSRLCDQLGVGAHEVIAFGDNQNDVTMLEWAGRGIAMANAVPEAKAAADEVTSSNVDFGVAEVLETLAA